MIDDPDKFKADLKELSSEERNNIKSIKVDYSFF